MVKKRPLMDKYKRPLGNIVIYLCKILNIDISKFKKKKNRLVKHVCINLIDVNNIDFI